MEPISVTGGVFDSVTGGPLPGAHVYTVRDGAAVGVATDASGEFAALFYPGETVTISMVGYGPLGYEVDGLWSSWIRVELEPGIDLGEVVIRPEPVTIDEPAAASGWGLVALIVGLARAAHNTAFRV